MIIGFRYSAADVIKNPAVRLEVRMKLLSRAEEIILLAVIKLEDNAYGVTIRDYIHEATGLKWSFASIYEPLHKLARKGFVRRLKKGTYPERGGRARCMYEITADGREALLSIRQVQERLSKDVPTKFLI